MKSCAWQEQIPSLNFQYFCTGVEDRRKSWQLCYMTSARSSQAPAHLGLRIVPVLMLHISGTLKHSVTSRMLSSPTLHSRESSEACHSCTVVGVFCLEMGHNCSNNLSFRVYLKRWGEWKLSLILFCALEQWWQLIPMFLAPVDRLLSVRMNQSM